MDLICCGISQRRWEFLAGENWLSALGNGFHALASHTAGSHSFFRVMGHIWVRKTKFCTLASVMLLQMV
jgi:hypothetical protein